MPHKTLVAVPTSEGKVSSVSSAVSNQLISVSKHFLAEFTSVPLGFFVDSGVLRQMFTLCETFVAN
jgi:hypothetical protein